MELKNYQSAVLERLSLYLQFLKKSREISTYLLEMYQKKEMEIDWRFNDFNFPKMAWDKLNEKNLLPLISTRDGETLSDFKSRFNGAGRPSGSSRKDKPQKPEIWDKNSIIMHCLSYV